MSSEIKEKIETLPVATDERLERCLAVRKAVFVEEEHVPPEIENDEYDSLTAPCRHYLLRRGGKDAGTLRVLSVNAETVRLQRFAVLAQYRHGGIGRAALRDIEDACRQNGVRRIVLDAQCTAVGFYEKCGYVGTSEVFLEAGIRHIKMEKTL